MAARATAQRIVTPVLDEVIAAHGGERADWARIFDEYSGFRWSEAVLRTVENDERRLSNDSAGIADASEMRARRGPFMRRLGGGKQTLAALFRSRFQSNIGGVTGVSDTWVDASFSVLLAGKSSDFIDYVDTSHAFSQGNSAIQVATPAADASFGNAATATFTAATGHRYSSNRAPSSFSFLQDGSGATAVLVWLPIAFVAAQHLLGNRLFTGAAGDIGFSFYRNNLTFGSSLQNGVTTVLNLSGSFVAGAPLYSVYKYAEGASPEASLSRENATTVATGSVAAFAAAPATALTLGANATGAGASSMRWRAAYLFRRALSVADEAIIRSFIQKDTGLPV